LDATDDPVKIREWWSQSPDSNIGIATGIKSGVVIVDVDPRNGGTTPEGMPDTVVVETGDGKHYYYRIDEELRACILQPGVDLLADGKYALAPPSIHPNGKQYRFVSQGVPLKPFPRSLFSKSQHPVGTPIPNPDRFSQDAIPEGGRNTHLISIGGVLRMKGCTYGVILATLQAENNARCRPPLSEMEVQRIAQSAAKYNEGPKLEFVNASTVLKEQVSWIWDSRIPAGKISLLEGDPGLGKSTIAALLVASVTSGSPLPGMARAEVRGKAIIASAEDGYGDTLVPRLEAAGADLSKVLFLQGLDLSKASHISALEKEVGHEVALIVIDPLMAYLGGINSNFDQSIREMTSRCSAMAQRSGAAFLFIRHWNKNTDGSMLYRGGGSIGIAGAARSVLAVIQDEHSKNLRHLTRVKGNLSQQPDDLEFELIGSPPKVVFYGLSSQT
jgi:energy-coupling factor transporter ATP-binding protein EcfA2